jgi:hypothetical protein
LLHTCAGNGSDQGFDPIVFVVTVESGSEPIQPVPVFDIFDTDPEFAFEALPVPETSFVQLTDEILNIVAAITAVAKYFFMILIFKFLCLLCFRFSAYPFFD